MINLHNTPWQCKTANLFDACIGHRMKSYTQRSQSTKKFTKLGVNHITSGATMTQSISMAIWWRARSSSSSNAVPLVLDDAFAYARRRLPWP